MITHYTLAAEADLTSIAQYTLEVWGSAQCDKYMALLEETCERILPDNIHHALPVPERAELLRWRCERHFIYFRLDGEDIEIVRVLHERMLPLNHL
jgi:toxin ParE1/3/4